MSAAAVLVEVKVLLGIATGDATRDAELNGYISQATKLIEQFLSKPVEQVSVTENHFDHYGPLILRKIPVIEITSITVDGTAIDLGTTMTTPEGRVFLLCNGVPVGLVGQNIEVVYSAGYADDYPSWLVDCIALTAVSYEIAAGSGEDSLGNNTIRKEVMQGVGSIEYAVADPGAVVAPYFRIPTPARLILAQHKDLEFADL